MTKQRSTHYSKLLPDSNWVDAEKMGDGKPTLTIARIKEEIIAGYGKDDPPKNAGIAYFKGTNKRLHLCKTNLLCLAAMFGPYYDDWEGKRVTLYAGKWKGEPAPRIWGSPDIDHDFAVTINLKRRKPFAMTMHRTSNGAPRSSPPPDDDPDYTPEPPPDSDTDNEAPMREPGED